MAEIHYKLVDTAVRVRGTLTTTEDEFEDVPVSVDDVAVELVYRGAVAGEGQDAVLQTAKGDREVAVKLTADGRVQSLDYKNTGVGPAVVNLGAKAIGFIGTILLSPLKSIGRLGVPADGGEGPPEGGDEKEKPDPRLKWEEAHPEAAELLRLNKAVAKAAGTQLAEIRKEIVDATELAAARELAARERLVEATLTDARTEVARLEALYVAWRSAKKSVRAAKMECVVEVGDLPERRPNAPAGQPPAVPPAPSELAEGSQASTAASPPPPASPSRQLYDDFKLILEVVDARRRLGATRPRNQEAWANPSEFLWWREPRPVELWIWKELPEGEIVLDSRRQIQVTDEYSVVQAMGLKSSFFGENGGSWTFNDDGSVATISANEASGAGALARALAAVPETLVGAVEQAKKLTDTVHGIQDAAAEREKAAAERDLATAKARIELLGVNATADDVAELARAEQAVKLRTATRATSPGADALDDLKQQLDLEKTKGDLEAQRRSAALATELSAVKSEVARLEQELLIAKAKWGIANPEPQD